MSRTKHTQKTSRRTAIKTLAAGAAVVMAPRFAKSAEGDMVKVGSGDHTYTWSNFGTPPEHIKYGNTHGVQVDSQGRVLIHHQNGHGHDSVVIFDADGKFIKSWGKEYGPGAHGFQLVKEGKQEFLILAATGQH